jgi:hypothetical protein
MEWLSSKVAPTGIAGKKPEGVEALRPPQRIGPQPVGEMKRLTDNSRMARSSLNLQLSQMGQISLVPAASAP